mgnify:CR=1 FL=1
MSRSTGHARTLRRLYLTLFLRGRSSRGLNLGRAPRSIASKLGINLLVYGLVGLTVLGGAGPELFPFALRLHTVALLFVCLFIVGSTGELLFNREESEILLHRPVEPAELLRAKVRVMVEVCLWLALSFNLAGLAVGSLGPGGRLAFLPAHLLSTALMAVFCCSVVVLLYQLCLRWLGRERVDNVMTGLQMLLILLVIVGAQVAPRMLEQGPRFTSVGPDSPLLLAFPPAWFAGLDAVLTGNFEAGALTLAGFAAAATLLVPWLALGRLAGTYQEGLQDGIESTTATHDRPRDGIRRLMRMPGLSWLLREPGRAAGFRLCAAYLARDRDTKLRFYPSIAPMLVIPVILLATTFSSEASELGLSFAAAYLATVPPLANNLLRFTQDWEASDTFRTTPMAGPGPLVHGARLAVSVLVVAPITLLMVVATLAMPATRGSLALLLPGILCLPLFSAAGGLMGPAIPLFRATEEARSASRGIWYFLMMMGAMILSGVGVAAWKFGIFAPFLVLETLTVAIGHRLLCRRIDALEWPAAE